MRDVRQGRTGAVPAHLRDAHYPGAKALGHGAGYLYPHDHSYDIVAQDYLPEGMSSPGYYQPTGNGHEATISASMQTIRQLTQEDDS
ncbi:hypothetical protein AVL60_04745 [Kocuria palustris]|nr:hypothetical protein AVL60_04745 [Kocuria palustris]